MIEQWFWIFLVFTVISSSGLIITTVSIQKDKETEPSYLNMKSNLQFSKQENESLKIQVEALTRMAADCQSAQWKIENNIVAPNKDKVLSPEQLSGSLQIGNGPPVESGNALRSEGK